MNEWDVLGRWARRRHKALTITLLTGSGEEAAFIGRMAVMESPHSAPLGALTRSPFWPDDLAFIRQAGDLDRLPPGGLVVANGSRRYLVSGLTYSRSALVLGGGMWAAP